MNLIDDDFFEFDEPELETDITFTFKSRFKIVDFNGFKLVMDKIQKRSLSKINLEILENLIDVKFPLNINDISGIELEDMKMNKFYNGEFEIVIYTSGIFDMTVLFFE